MVYNVLAMITIKGLALNFGEQQLLRGVDWFIAPKSRIGLVGDNGAGKTTLLRILAGLQEYDEGSVVLPPAQARTGYLPQDLVEIDDVPLLSFLYKHAGLEDLKHKLEAAEAKMASLNENSAELKNALSSYEQLQREFDARGGYDFEVEATKVLKGLGFRPKQDLPRRTSEFSGGWKMRIALAALLLSEPDLLLLDEPTNHLDTESMEWLEGWLRDFRGTMIAVSHDRRFLENMATSVAELSFGKITTYSMGYDKFLAEREARRARLEAEREQQKERIAEMEHFIERFRYKATKAAQVQSRIKQLEKLEITEVEARHKTVNFKFPDAPRSGLEVLKADNLKKQYGDNLVFDNVSFSIQRGERVALVGVNGAGKSTLLRLLNKSEEPTLGEVTLGLNVKRKFFSQESSQNLDYSKTIWEEVSSTGSKLEAPARRNLLGAFLFSGDDIYKKISVLSGGEKSRIGLLKMLLTSSNLLILDEPTNHLDYSTKELFQRALLGFAGTILIVSHDRAFLDSLVTRVLEIRDGKLYDYKGNYSYFIERRAQLAAQQEPQPKAAEPIKTKEQKRAEAEERNRLFKSRKKYLDELKTVENTLFEAEKLKEELSGKLCDPEFLQNSTLVSQTMIELKNCEREIEENYKNWERLSLLLEQIQ